MEVPEGGTSHARPRKGAAIIPLHYPSRIEHVVLYYSEYWEELGFLLQAPLEFLRAEQFKWTQHFNPPIAWQLISPVAATIECGFTKKTRLSEAVDRFNSLLPDEPLEGLEGESFAQKTEAVRNRMSKGAFFVEFAAYTDAIRIVVFPPKPKKESYNRYPIGKVSDVSIASISNISNMNVIHFDLLDSSAKGIADFVMSELESPGFIASILNDSARAGKVDWFPKVALLGTPPGSGIRIPPSQGLKPGTTFAARKKQVCDRPDESAEIQTMIVRGLSTPDSCSGCLTCKASGTPGGPLSLEFYELERYLSSRFDNPRDFFNRAKPEATF